MTSSAFSSSSSSSSNAFDTKKDEVNPTPPPTTPIPTPTPHLLPEKIIIVGSSNQDLTSYTNIIPKLGETVMGERFEVSAGGKGANQAIAAAKMLLCPKQNKITEKQNINRNHANNVHIITRVGNDAFAKLLLQNFDETNVKYNPKTIMCEESHTGVAPIVVDQKTGDNMIVVIPGANKLLTPDMVREEMSTLKNQINDIHRAIILSQLEVPIESTLEAMKIGKEWGVRTILNPAPCNTSILDNGLLKYVDILIPNETELYQLFDAMMDKKKDSLLTNNPDNDNHITEEDMAKTLLQNGIVQQAVIVTLGARGAMIVSRNGDDYETKMVNASQELDFNNKPIVDTVGAGDSFCGSLSMYLSYGIELEEAATKACGVASMSVRGQGAQTSYPSAEDLPQELRLDGFDEKQSSSSFSSSASLSTRKTLTFVTGNKKKLEEVQQILSSGEEMLPFDITNRKIDLPELQGDPIDIAKEKCALAAKEVDGPVFTEDTSLCFNALNSLPGPYIKWFLEKCGHDGLNRMLTGFEDKSAYAQTIVAFTWGPGEDIFIFDGKTNGSIVKPRGSLDFGWDPIFEPDESNGLTYAEMTKEDKNIISHRGKSFTKFQSFLTSCGTGCSKE